MQRGRGEENIGTNKNLPKPNSSTLMFVFGSIESVQADFLSDSITRARWRYTSAFMPKRSQFMKHDQPNGTKGN